LLKEIPLKDEPLNLDLTFCSGQIFRWWKKDGWWHGWVGESELLLKVKEGNIEYRSYPYIHPDRVSNFLMLDLKMQAVYDTFPKDELSSYLVKKYRGLRVLRQNPWECFISYIVSASMSIDAINSILNRLASTLSPSGKEVGSRFPGPREMLTMQRPRRGYLGRRWDYLKGFASLVEDGTLNFNDLRRMEYIDAWRRLVSGDLHTKGVGPKVADCALLFSLDKLEAFPIDRWVYRGLARYYPDLLGVIGESRRGEAMTIKRYALISESARNRFGRYGGVFQEYLFLHSRSGNTGLG
jgi:N-glycosylase/DNA lyase